MCDMPGSLAHYESRLLNYRAAFKNVFDVFIVSFRRERKR